MSVSEHGPHALTANLAVCRPSRPPSVERHLRRCGDSEIYFVVLLSYDYAELSELRLPVVAAGGSSSCCSSTTTPSSPSTTSCGCSFVALRVLPFLLQLGALRVLPFLHEAFE